jgi:hypothetical protein
MKTEMRHAKWNINYPVMTAEDLANLTPEQAVVMADLFNQASRTSAEAYFILSCHEMKSVPDELKKEWPKAEDYKEFPAE